MARDRDDEVAREIRTHLELEAEERVADGLSEEDARDAAHRAFGSVARTQEDVRAVWTWSIVDGLRRDLQFGFRAMARRPGFTALAVLTMAVGIGATAAIFSVADRVLFRPLPFPDADRLVAVWEVRPAFNRPRVEAAPLNYVDWAREAESFEALAAYFYDAANLTESGTPERLPFAGVTPNLLPMLGVRPIVGRWFESPDGAPGQPPVAILSYGLWQRRFGGDQGIVGRVIRLGNQPTTVVGVMPQGFQFPHPRVQAWVPVDYAQGAGIQSRTLFALNVVGRLRPGVPVAQATNELGAIAERLAREYPTNENSSAVAVLLQDELTRADRTSLLLLLAAAGLVLLIACANVAGLLLTRAASRDGEFAVRTALGASRRQLVRQLIVEGLLLSGAGAIVGLTLAVLAFRLLDTLVPDSLRGAVTPSLDFRLLACGAGAALLTGLVFGLVPLRHAFQRNLRTPLAARTGQGPGTGRPLRALVAIEVTLCVVVLFSTALMLQTILNLETAEIGFEKQNVLTARVELSPAEYPTLQHRLNFHGELLDRLAGLPGVVSAGLTTFLPYTETIISGPLRVEDRPDLLDLSRQVYLRAITPGYLPALRVPLVAGRGFTAGDTADTEPVAIVTEQVNAALGGNLIGQRVAFGLGGSDFMRVVGVAGDIRYDGIDVVDSRGALYVPAAQLRESAPNAAFFAPRDLAVRTTGSPLAIASALQEAIWDINPNQPVADVRTLDALVDDQIVDRKVQTTLVSTFAGLALFMAAMGVYGLLSFTVAARTRELGVRVALGARGVDLIALVSRGSLRWVAAGLALGSAAALAASRAMSSVIYGVEPMDWTSLAASTLVIGSAAVAAALLPVWRAARIDPVIVLRGE